MYLWMCHINYLSHTANWNLSYIELLFIINSCFCKCSLYILRLVHIDYQLFISSTLNSMVSFLLMFISAFVPLGRAWEFSGSISLPIVVFIFLWQLFWRVWLVWFVIIIRIEWSEWKWVSPNLDLSKIRSRRKIKGD